MRRELRVSAPSTLVPLIGKTSTCLLPSRADVEGVSSARGRVDLVIRLDGAETHERAVEFAEYLRHNGITGVMREYREE